MPRNFVIDRGGSVYLASALRTLWTYRAIILAFAERNIRVKYKQSALGIA
jgi:homopolymeric O-antigen transport system permease protein